MPRSTQRDPNAIQTKGFYHVRCYDKDGNLKWEENAENAVFDEGEQSILDVYFRGATAPTSFFIGLLKNSLATIPVETTTMGTLTVATHEPTNATEPGYSARQTVNRDGTAAGWPTLALNSGDYQVTSKVVSWTASANWTGTIRWLFMTTGSATVGNTTGLLLSVSQLSADRLLLSGDQLQITYNIKLQ